MLQVVSAAQGPPRQAWPWSMGPWTWWERICRCGARHQDFPQNGRENLQENLQETTITTIYTIWSIWFPVFFSVRLNQLTWLVVILVKRTGLGTMRFPAWIDRFCSVILSRQWQSADAPTNARQARYKKQFHKLIVYIDGRYMASDSVKYRQGKDTFRYEVSCRSFGSQPRKKWLCCSPTWRERCGSGSVLGVLHNWTFFCLQ